MVRALAQTRHPALSLQDILDASPHMSPDSETEPGTTTAFSPRRKTWAIVCSKRMTHPLAFPTVPSISGPVLPTTRQPSGGAAHTGALVMQPTASAPQTRVRARRFIARNHGLTLAQRHRDRRHSAAGVRPPVPRIRSTPTTKQPNCYSPPPPPHRVCNLSAHHVSMRSCAYLTLGDARYAAAADRAAKALWKRRSQVTCSWSGLARAHSTAIIHAFFMFDEVIMHASNFCFIGRRYVCARVHAADVSFCRQLGLLGSHIDVKSGEWVYFDRCRPTTCAASFSRVSFLVF
jgi:hypothetical protein